MHSIAPTLIVADVASSASYYRTCLGFEFAIPAQAAAHLAGDFAMLVRGGVTIQLKAARGACPASNATIDPEIRQDAFLRVEDPDALHEEYRAAGVRIVSPVEDTPWGTREFRFADDSGYVFACGRATEAQPG